LQKLLSSEAHLTYSDPQTLVGPRPAGHVLDLGEGPSSFKDLLLDSLILFHVLLHYPSNILKRHVIRTSL